MSRPRPLLALFCTVGLMALMGSSTAKVLQEVTFEGDGPRGALRAEMTACGMAAKPDGTRALLLSRPGESQLTLRFNLAEMPTVGKRTILVMALASTESTTPSMELTYSIRANGYDVGVYSHHVDRIHLWARDITPGVRVGENVMTLALHPRADVGIWVQYAAITESTSTSFVEPELDRFRVDARWTKLPLLVALLLTCATLCTVMYDRANRQRGIPIRSAQIRSLVFCGLLGFASVLALYGVTPLSILGGVGALAGVVVLIFLLNR